MVLGFGIGVDRMAHSVQHIVHAETKNTCNADKSPGRRGAQNDRK